MGTVTLQNLCLKVIVSEFNWYCEVNCSTEDSCLKLKFEFLKKKYSLLILEKLRDERRLEAKYLDFLINKYLKVLDTRWLRTWPWEVICQRLAEIGANLKEVTFFRYDMPWEEVLCYLPNLKSVSFKYFCADKFLLALSKFCKCVETLNVNGSRNVSHNGLMHLCCKDNDENIHSLPASIKELLVDYTNVGDEGIANALKNMPFLEKIYYYEMPKVLYSMHKSDINALDKVKPYNLTHLDLQYVSHDIPEFTNVFTVCAFVCPRLKSLCCTIDQKHDLELCSQLQELEELELICACDVEDPLELNELLTRKGKKLTSLRIHNCCMSLSVLAQNCPNLISLGMTNVFLQYNCNDSVPVFHNLEKVVIKDCTEADISKAVSCLLISAPNLKQLCFHYCDLHSSDIEIHILRCCEQFELNVIDFWRSSIKLDLVRDVLLTCSTLQTLYLKDFSQNVRHKLQTLSTSLPNKPQICFDDSYGHDNDYFVYNQDVSSDDEGDDKEEEEGGDEEEEDYEVYDVYGWFGEEEDDSYIFI